MDGRRVGMYRERPGSDIVRQGFLKKLKTMKKKFFVLRSTSSSGPSRLDYYDNEKKFKTNHPPKKSYLLHTFFNVNKRTDTKHKFVIAIFLPTECFSVIAESQAEQEEWVNDILVYQNEYLPQDTEPRPHYEYVWQGTVKLKSPTSCSKVTGPFRLCLSDKAVSLVRFSEYKPGYQFQFKSVRRCGHSDNFFFMEVGRSAVTGIGEIWMQVEENSMAQNMHDAVLAEMAASRVAEDPFRRRSNTGSSATSHHGGETYNRKRATSESHRHGSPRSTRSQYGPRRPVSSVGYTTRTSQLVVDNPVPLASSPSAFDHSMFDKRVRSDSMGSRSSHTSHHSDMVDHPYENSNPGTPMMSPEGSFISARSLTPEGSYSITEEDQSDSQDKSDYLPMTPGQRSLTPSPTRSQGYLDRGGDYLPMTPGQRSGTPSPTRFTERPASAGSHESGRTGGGYMDMTPGSIVSSPVGNHDTSMAVTPPKSSSSSMYMDMTPTTPVLHHNNGYIDMNPGQRTPTDPGPGYVIMDGAYVRPTAPIPIRANKEPGYMEMGPASQPLPTVKESGSGEAYLPMSPSNMSTMSSDGLKPTKVVSYLSDDSMSGEFPKRAYSVGSRPISKQPFKVHQAQEMIRRQPLDSSKSSSAPHLIVQKSRSPFIDTILRNSHPDGSYPASPLSQSVKSDDSDSFMEMEFYRPRTASDSYGCRPRSSSFGKQYFQGHRPRSSSYGQGAKGTMSKLAAGSRTDSYDSVRTTSMELSTKHRSQESLGMVSSSSRNSSSESLKKLGENTPGKKNLLPGDYMDMSYDKRKTPSPNIQSMASPRAEPTGYMDMTLGTNVPKSVTRGISPCSSTHSLPSSTTPSLGSSPASSLGHGHSEKFSNAKVIKPSGKIISQKHSFKASSTSENQLKVATARLKISDKRSPSSSGKESEDESYVPFQPKAASSTFVSADDSSVKLHSQSPYELGLKSHPGIKVQHGYSKSHDSAMRSSDAGFFKSDKPGKSKKEDKHKTEHGKSELHKSKSVKEKKSVEKKGSISEKLKGGLKSNEHKSDNTIPEQGHSSESPTFVSIPDDDLFSDKMFRQNSVEVKVDSPDSPIKSIAKSDNNAYMDFSPGIEQSKIGKSEKSGNGGVSKPKAHAEVLKPFEPKHTVEREYCEIDFSPVSQSVNVSQSENVESDYIMADPALLQGKEKVPAGKLSGEVPTYMGMSLPKVENDFSYMDFDPKTLPSDGPSEIIDESMKSPSRVKSFVAHSMSVDETAERKPGEIATSHESRDKNLVNIATNMAENANINVGCWKRSVDEMSGNSENSSQNVVNIKPLSGEGHAVGQVVSMEGNGKNVSLDFDSKSVNNGKKQTVIEEYLRSENKDKDAHDAELFVKTGKGKKLDKLIVKQITHHENQPVQDEGYCDLDFSDKDNIFPDMKGNIAPRSDRVPSGNSDKESGRRILESVASDDSIPCPETPISYISDDTGDIPMPETPQSYISDDSNSSSASSKDLSSPFKSPLGGRSSVPVGGKMPGFGLASFGLSGDSLRKSLPPSRTHGGSNPVFFAPISRQSSVPVCQSVSPRVSGELPPQLAYRSRKASGPAVLSSQTTQGNNGCKLASPGCLEPVVAGQELHKQKSMPCMNVPLQRDKLQDSEHIDHVQSRHSFTDLSQYEEMSFPGNSLSSNNQIKCSSQQQLSGETSVSNELPYADLDLKGSTENMDGTSPRIIKSRHPSSLDDVSREPVQYAEIDHLKTEKMKNTSDKDVMFYVN